MCRNIPKKHQAPTIVMCTSRLLFGRICAGDPVSRWLSIHVGCMLKVIPLYFHSDFMLYSM